MKTQFTTLDFTGQTIDCGIDTHKKDWKVCIRDSEYEHQTFTIPASGKALADFLKKNYPKAYYRCVYEAGFAGFVPYYQLKTNGIDCLVVHPADVPTADKERKQKSDRVDCRKLARGLSNGDFRGIHVPSQKEFGDRNMVRVRLQLVKDQTRLKNRIKSFLFTYDVCIGLDENEHWSRRYLKRLQDLGFEYASQKSALNILLESLLQTQKQLLQVTRLIRQMSQQPPYKEWVDLLRSIPGIGLINAMIFLTEIQDIRRFKSVDHLCGYFGLVPDIYSSSDKKYTLGITSRGNSILRTKIVESAWVIIRKDPAMILAYKNYKKRMESNKAIIKIARKLLARIRYVLIHKAPYQSRIVNAEKI